MPAPAPTTQQKQKQSMKMTRRRPKSRYGSQLEEKQQLKEIYGLREEQLRKYYRDALSHPGETGPYLIALLERRLDNAIYRAGFAVTRPQARQMASHSLFSVNGHPVTIPSIRLKKGDIVTVKPTKQAKSYFTNFDKRMQNVRPPSWILLNPAEFSFTVVGEPSADEAAIGVDIRSVLEFFTR